MTLYTCGNIFSQTIGYFSFYFSSTKSGLLRRARNNFPIFLLSRSWGAGEIANRWNGKKTYCKSIQRSKKFGSISIVLLQWNLVSYLLKQAGSNGRRVSSYSLHSFLIVVLIFFSNYLSFYKFNDSLLIFFQLYAY